MVEKIPILSYGPHRLKVIFGVCCPLRGSTQHLTQTKHTATVKKWMELGDSYKRIGRRTAGPKGHGNSIRRSTESTNLNPWGSQSLNHQPKNIYGVDLDLPAYMRQILAAWSSCGSQTNGVGAIPKAVACLWDISF